MPLPRRAPFLLALSLLTAAATAHAECAWVLWDGQFPNVPNSDILWSVVGTYSAAKECKADLAEHVAVQRRGGDEVTDPRSGTALYKRGNFRGYLHCLPDTVDPRGPKGGGQ
jgi:hypothetical protein